MTNETEENTYTIPEINMERLHKEVAKLNKRAAKLHCPPISIEVVAENLVTDPSITVRTNMTEEEVAALPKVREYEIQINGEGPKINGYRFVGTLDHYTIPGSVIVKTVPGESVPQEFFKSDATCHHCNKIRRRIETFVVYNEEFEIHKQVGRNCLRDFFGHDPAYIARYLTRLIGFLDSLKDEDDWGWGGGRYDVVLNSKSVLIDTIALIRTHGWVPRSAADEDHTATADLVSYMRVQHMPNVEAERDRQDFIASLIRKSTDAADADAALAWLGEQESSNDYMHNLKTLKEANGIPSRMLGFWCSLVAAHQRAMDQLEIRKRENATKLNEYVGEIKERLEMEVTCIGIRYIPSDWGSICIHRMLDDKGRTLVWFANAGAKMDKGDVCKVKATVVDHNEYKDWKQTKVNRLNVLEVLSTSDEEEVE